MKQYRFHEFTLQVEQRRLLAPGGEAMELTPRLFDALLFMVERPGDLLDKETLLAALWPGLVVEENSLNQCVSALRKTLADDAQSSRFIQTVPRRGFRFIAPVSLVADVADADADAAAEPDPETEPAPIPAPDAHNPARPGAPTTAATPQRAMNRRVWVATSAVGAVALVAAGAAAWRWRGSAGSAPQTGAPSTLAVLPFKPIVAGARDELLEIGMAESLVARLSNLPGMAVRSVGSVRRYAGAEQDPIAAARDLNVTWIVDGSVQRLDGRVRVTARLLNTASGEAAWSGRFDETFTGVFDLQESISSKVAQVLAPRLQRRSPTMLPDLGGTRDVDAYQHYLTARQQAQGIRNAGLLKSVELYQLAIARDPSYAQAWAGMAESYRRMVFGADGEPAVVFVQAARSNQRAVQLEPNLPAGHAGIGWNRFWGDFDWPGAAQAFDHALSLNPSESNAHLGYSQLMDTLERKEEALVHLRLARESDPLSLILLTLEIGPLVSAGRVEEARQRLQRVLDIEPDFWVAKMVQAGFLLRDGKTEEAIEQMARADRFADGSSQAAAALGNLLARKGQPDKARQVLARLEALSKTRYVPPTSMGLIHAGLGDKAAAMAALERGYTVRDVRMTLVKQDGRWKLVHDDPRYAALMQRMKLA